MRHEGITAEEVIGQLASASYGVVTRPQLLAAGITLGEIRHRLGTGALLQEHRGVYRVGHRAPSVAATYLAAVRACGEEALLCDCAAGHLLGVLKGAAPGPEVMAPTVKKVPGVHTRRSSTAEDAYRWRGIPVTSVPRTLVDLAAVLSLDALARVCHEAGVLHKTTPAHVKAVMARRPNAPGAANLRCVIEGDAHVVLSKLEKRFLELLLEAGLPLPQTNRAASGRRVDCRWPEYRLTVELDSYTYHSSRHAWELDRRREREAYARGDQFRRYTRDDVFEHPARMLAELRALLLTPPGTRSAGAGAAGGPAPTSSTRRTAA